MKVDKYMMRYFGFIYEWIDSTNDKNYVGSHKGSIEDDYIGSGTLFMRAYDKRPEKFNRKILEYVFENDRKILLEIEQKYLNLIDWSNTYNILTIARGCDGMKGKRHSEIAKRRMRKPRDEETKQRMRKPKTESHKKNISDSKKGEKNPMYGKLFSVEHKQKISEKLKGIKKEPFTDQHKRNISKAKKGNTNGQGNKGKPWSFARRKAHERKKNG